MKKILSLILAFALVFSAIGGSVPYIYAAGESTEEVQSDDPSFTVSFDSNGGSYVEAQTVTLNGTAYQPVPSKEGFWFDGWYTDTDLSLCFDFSTPITGDLLLYAKWLALMMNTLAEVLLLLKPVLDRVTSIAMSEISMDNR